MPILARLGACVQNRETPIDRGSGITYNVTMTDSILDSQSTYAALDPEGLLARITELPSQIEMAWRTASAFALPADYRDANRIVVLGMGGSGIGGSLLRALALDVGAATPVDVVRGYTLPAYVSKRTLVIASSNSGNTEEVVAALSTAIDGGAHCSVIATGGRLLALARTHGLPALSFTWDGEPRSALGWSFIAPLAICSGLGLLPDCGGEIATAVEKMEVLVRAIGADVPEATNPAKQLARRLAGSVPVIVGAEALAPVAYRWRTQMNENAKSWAIAEELPEMNHNAPLGYSLPAALVQMLHVVLLRHASMHPRIGTRVAITQEQMGDAGIPVEVLEMPGSSVLSQMLGAIEFGDFTSYYLGLLNGVHPSPMGALEWIKQRMAASGDASP